MFDRVLNTPLNYAVVKNKISISYKPIIMSQTVFRVNFLKIKKTRHIVC